MGRLEDGPDTTKSPRSVYWTADSVTILKVRGLYTQSFRTLQVKIQLRRFDGQVRSEKLVGCWTMRNMLKHGRYSREALEERRQLRASETIPAKISCDVLNNGPGTLVATFGRIKVRIVSAASTANAALAPWT